MSRPALLALSIAALLALLALAGNPPVQRTQEARVLETARQMLPAGPDGWLIPHLNGRLRLQKPPLAYWMAAASFKLFGVSDSAGRLPFLLCGWLLLGVLFVAARRLFDESTAVVACLLTLGSYLFFRYTRLAETDAPAALFVTTAIAAITFAASLAPSRKEVGMYHLGAAATALAALAKGGPAAFPLLFLLFASIAERKNLVWRFIKSGAPITLLLIAIPWYAYAIQTHGWDTFRREMQNNLEGGDHGMPAYEYVPWLAMALLPWTLFTLLAVIGIGQTLWYGFRNSPTRREARNDTSERPDRFAMRTFGDFTEDSPSFPAGTPQNMKLLAAWFFAIAIPLMLTGNKQLHYLMPLMPPLMIATAWFIQLVIAPRAPRHLRWLARGALLLVTVGMMGAAYAMAIFLLGSRLGTHTLLTSVGATVVVAIILVLTVAASFKSLRACLFTLVGVAAIAMPFITGYAAPRLDPQNPRQVASELRLRYADAPMAFFGPNVSLPLCYNLRKEIPSIGGPALLAMLPDHPNLVVIAQDKAGRSPAAPPAPFVQDGQPIMSDDQTFTFYRAQKLEP